MSCFPYLFLVLVQAQPVRDAVARLDAKGPIRLSETLRVTLTVEGGQALQVEAPSVAESRQWKVVRQTKGEKRHLKDNQWRWQAEIELEPAEPGKLSLPEIVLKYRNDSKLEWTSKKWDDTSIEVLGPEGMDVRGELPIEPVPPSPSLDWLPLVQVMAGLLFLALLCGVLWWWRRPKPAVILSPDVRALRDLEQLRSAQPEAIHAGVSAIVRRFVEERFGVQAPRQTSEEILQSARASEVFPRDRLEPLAGLLAECDRVKFTGTAPTRESCEEAVTVACQFIRDSSAG